MELGILVGAAIALWMFVWILGKLFGPKKRRHADDDSGDGVAYMVRYPHPKGYAARPTGQTRFRVPDSASVVRLEERTTAVQVVGESYRQDAIEKLVGGKCPEGFWIDCDAALVREPKNPVDANAVMVMINGVHVGYLKRELAARMCGYLDELAAEGKTAVCGARIVGGWRRGPGDGWRPGEEDEGSFGVKLFFRVPKASKKKSKSA